MTSFSAEQVPWAEQQDYVLSVKIGAITLISTVVLWLLLLLVLKILIMGEKDKKTQARKSTKLTRKVKGELDALVKKLEREWELKGADLFAPLPSTEDCAICLVPLPRIKFEKWYQTCCGKEICWACFKENEESIKKQNDEKSAGKKVTFTCPFCREPEPTSKEEYFCQYQTRCLQNDPYALGFMGAAYQIGGLGLPKDDLKALDCYIRAVDLGSSAACSQIGIIYHEGNGVAVDKERAALFERIGALRGSIAARHRIGCIEYYSLGNNEIGIRHWKFAAEAGNQRSLNKLRDIYNTDGKYPGKEFISKEYMEFAFRACHEA